MDIAPSLATHLKIPLATDAIGMGMEGESFSITRQLYGGKVNAKVSFTKPGPYIVTVRSGAFPVSEWTPLTGEMIPFSSSLTGEALTNVFYSTWSQQSGKWISPRQIS
jgi:electron transfer flavoprotein alpha subunit